ncbi:complex I subunit 5 family protein [Streptomyces griseocarneus]|uniref:complex I subunit 5 family protein n=1 Tax=Streptomyces griseocarneus TaxID=51201 RepID=UPI001CCF9409|nr:complex I subunit 5 family protein [Streptomyces griseocarneus]MBZ6474268.1 NADH-quinone oxidoreductase subunit D [Streptomyces griseocarneus]
MDRLLPLIVVVPLLGAAVLVGAGRRMPRLAAETVACACAAASAALACAALAGPATAVSWVGDWRPRDGVSVGIVLVGDRLGLGLAALASVLIVAVLTYSWRYFEEPPRGHAGAFPALVLLFQAGMCGFALTGDLFDAFVFFELMGVVGYALTGYHVEEARPVQGALAFGFVNSLGGYATLMGIALLYARTGELGMAQIGRRLDAAPGHDALVAAAFVLVVTGLLVKAAAVPFHFWLPDAHAVAPTPVCLVLSGVMVETGVYGVARVHATVFGGPGGIPADGTRRVLVVLGVVSALTGAVMCWQQRHIKRLLAFSTVGHTGLFLVGVGLLTPEGLSGTCLYVLGHAGAKAALFACTGILLARLGSVDERELHGRGRDIRGIGLLFALGGLALAGLPPFGTGLGKAVVEEQAAWLPALFGLVSALTGGAALRVAARVFLGAGERGHDERETAGGGEKEPETAGGEEEPETVGGEGEPETAGGEEEPETAGGEEEPETGHRIRLPPPPMVSVAVALLAGALAVGTVPALAEATAAASFAFLDHAGYAAAVLDGRATGGQPGHGGEWWTWSGAVLGLLSAALAVVLAAAAVVGLVPSRGWSAPLRRLHSGHIGDYVAWTMAGIGLLSLLTLW